MPAHQRNPDFIARHIDLTQRVSNLETGVHPTTTGYQWFDSYPLTRLDFVSSSGWDEFSLFPANQPAYWSRKNEVVSLSGGIYYEPETTPPDEEVFAVLPDEARPLSEIVLTMTLDNSPFLTRLRVKTDGEMSVINDNLNSGSNVGFLDGLSWPIN